MTNREVADLFEKVADMLAIRGDQIHRILAYRRAAENIRALGRDLHTLHAEGALTEIPGIGTTLAEKIGEMLTTGRLQFYERLTQEIPPALVEWLRVEGLGPKKVKLIHDTLGLTTLAELEAAAREGRLRHLPGMGEKSEAKIIANVALLARHGDGRTSIGVALPIAQEILRGLAALPGVTQAAVGGSLRRLKETIGDLDLLVAAAEAAPIMEWFTHLEQVESVTGRGPTKSSVVLHNGLNADLRVLPAERWGTLLAYFTGSQAHNIRLRELALKQGLSLNEHAFRPLDGGAEQLCATEEEVYQTLGLPTILPPLRQDRGEIEAAQRGQLPRVVTEQDIQGDLHTHTTWSDGRLSILEMARTAQSRGWRYLAITDHSASLGVVNGLTVERLRQQAAEIHQANEAIGPGFHILHGTEMEIKADGSLDYPDEVLAELDFVIASLHTSLGQPREQVTRRVLNAIHNPHVDMIGHPTGRMIPDRMGADLDMEAILAAAAQTGTILEINANPHRLDLRDSHVRRAVELGVRLAINTDAHHSDHFDFMGYGVGTAQRGWATAANVVNTQPFRNQVSAKNLVS
ncbi:MAG: DNA polymerase/3'-5' exonuclease PolX [Chloroflexota bacterium]